MKIRLDLADTARDLSAVLKNRSSYEKVIRETHWMKGLLIIIGSGASRLACLAAARAFEWLLGWPATVKEAVEFGAYVLPALPPRSLLIAVSPSGGDENLLEILWKARQRGATALALTQNAESSLARMMHRTFSLPCGEEVPSAIRTAFVEHAALLYIVCVTASIFNPRHPLAGDWEQEFEGLPERLAWMRAHLGEAVGSAAGALKQAHQTLLTAGGLYHPSALHAAWIRRQFANTCTQVFEPHELLDSAPGGLAEADVALILSASHCRIKKSIHSAAARLKEKKVRVFSLTDSNDRQLVQSSELAILLPVLSEVTGSLLELALLQWLMVASTG
jgi:glutamine---fructose-6-phosphate transaminase (isomerizing)